MTGLKWSPNIIQWVVGEKTLTARNSMFRDESKTCSSWRLHNSASIIYHLKASPKVKHQSCLLLLNSSDLLIPKVWLMDNSFYLWVKYNQYLESFVCLCTVWEITSAGPEKKMGGYELSEGNRQSRTEDCQVQCWESHLCMKLSIPDGYISL